MTVDLALDENAQCFPLEFQSGLHLSGSFLRPTTAWFPPVKEAMGTFVVMGPKRKGNTDPP
jgi:hypothetical protein